MANAGDEAPRSPGLEADWADAWEIDFAAGDGSGVGGFVRLALLPNRGTAWWWTVLLTPRLVAVRDHEVPLPRAGLEVRADGLWGELVCETPLEHWSVGLEAFGIAYDDPADAWGDEWGERLAVGLDLEWEATGAADGSRAGASGPAADLPPAGPVPEPGPAVVAYAHPGRVHGQILVGPDRIPVSGTGFRSRASGVLDWWSARSHRRLGWVSADGTGTVAPDAGDRVVTELGRAPLLVTAPGRPALRLARALCRIDGPGGGLGWAERFPSPIRRS